VSKAREGRPSRAFAAWTLFIGVAEAALPAFGGSVLVDVGLPFTGIPLFIPGLPTIPGAGALTLPGADLSGLEGTQWVLQFLAADPAAGRRVDDEWAQVDGGIASVVGWLDRRSRIEVVLRRWRRRVHARWGGGIRSFLAGTSWIAGVET